MTSSGSHVSPLGPMVELKFQLFQAEVAFSTSFIPYIVTYMSTVHVYCTRVQYKSTESVKSHLHGHIDEAGGGLSVCKNRYYIVQSS